MASKQTFCGGRLVEETAQVNVGGAETNFRDHYIPGRSRWLLDGEEITPTQAEDFHTAWQAEQHPEIPTEGRREGMGAGPAFGP